MSKILFFVFMLIVTPVMAQENSPAACKLIPDKNNVVYQAGIDVNGNAVVPADLNAGHQMGDVLNVVKVPLEFDLAQRISGLNTQGVDLDAALGMLEIHQSGKVVYNGQDITKPVMTICAKSHKEVNVEMVEAVDAVKPVKAMAPKEPIAPQFNEAAAIEKPLLPSKLTIDSAEEALIMPSVSAPIVEVVKEPTISVPDQVKQPLIATPDITKSTSNIKNAESDLLKGQDHRDYNE